MSVLTVPLLAARRLAVCAQRLAGLPPTADADTVHQLVHHLGCLQLDPTNVVARNPDLVLWSRLGNHDRTLLANLLWKERRLFEYWAHAASICDVADLGIHRLLMRTRARSGYLRQAEDWLRQNPTMRRHVLRELAARGPLTAGQIEDRTTRPWQSGGWTAHRNTAMVLQLLHLRGRVLVAGRRGRTRLWDLAERVLPPDAPSERPPAAEVVRRAMLRSVRALGIARAADIRAYFTRDRYPGLAAALARAQRAGVLTRVAVDGLSGDWFVHRDDQPLLERLASGDGWFPRTTLLSPFDSLIADRARTQTLFGMEVVLEIYTPPARRRWGYFVLPVLHGDALVARADLRLDRARRTLQVQAFHSEPGVRAAGAAHATGAALADLAAFVDARQVSLPPLPAGWQGVAAAL